MISVAILGEYKKEDAIYVINSLLNQVNVEIELIISNDLDFPICELTDALNIHQNKAVKNVLINIDDCSLQKHLEYISKQMSGDGLLCLWNGSALYDNDSLGNCVSAYQGEFVVAKNVLYKRKSGYFGEIPSTSDSLEALQTVLQAGYNGGIIFPKDFVSSEFFLKIENWDEEIYTTTLNYINTHNVKEKVVINQNPLIKCYVSAIFRDKDYEIKKFIEENISEWRALVEKKRISLNYSGYVEVCSLMDLVKVNRNAIRLVVEKRIRQIVLEENNSAWGIIDSNKALIVYLKELCIIRHRENLRWELLKFRMRLNYHKKVKVVMTVAEYFSWMSCYKSVYDELTSLKNKKLFDVSIVYVSNQEKSDEVEFQKWTNSGMNVVRSTDYDVSKECPDVIFYYKPYDVQDVKWCAKEIYKAIKKIIYIPNYVMLNIEDENLVYQNYNLAMHLLAWKILVNNKKYAELIDKHAYQKNNKLLIGHPEFDLVDSDSSVEDQKTIDKIRKIAGVKKIVYLSLKIDLSNEAENKNFLENGFTFIKNTIYNNNALIVWRTSKDFIDAIQIGRFGDELKEVIKYGQDSNMLYLDVESSYWPVFLISDILVTDWDFLVERYIARNKPIIYLTEEDDSVFDGVIYKEENYDKVDKRLIELLDNQDVLKEYRHKYLIENYYLSSKSERVATRLINLVKGEFNL